MLRITLHSSDNESREVVRKKTLKKRNQVIGRETVLQPSAIRTVNGRE
jgi:hypothetical protein